MSRRWVGHVRASTTVVTLASFLASMSPVHLAHADDAPQQAAQSTERPTEAGHESLPEQPKEPKALATAPSAAIAPAPADGARAEIGSGNNNGHSPMPTKAAPLSPALTGHVTPASLPVNGNDKTGVSSQAIALPQGTGKIQGMGESFSTQLSTGVANFTVPFALLPARGGAQPSLSLSYSSASGHGIAGVGWDVGVPFISRQTDRGIPQYQDPQPGTGWQPTQDRFIFNGGQELVPICLVQGTTCSNALPGEVMPAWGSGWQYFRPRVEGGFLRFFWSPDHRTWRVQSKSGTSMELGAPLDGSGYTGALETDPTGSRIFRWDLVREYDAYGGANPSGSTAPTPLNIVAYRYQQGGGMAYLSDIYDTPPAANPSSAPLSAYAHHVHLSYETRTDPSISFTRGWRTTMDQRLVGVDVTSQTFGGSATREMVRRYHLAYDSNYHISLLTSVQEEGRCNTAEDAPNAIYEDGTGILPATSCPMLPAMAFGYSHVQGYDINGNPQASDLSGYEPFDERVIKFSNSPPNSIDEDVTDLFDINSDGLPDVLVTNPAQFNGNLGVYFNSNGTGGQPNTFSGAFQMPVTGVPNEDANTINLLNLNVSAADIDGDGVIDLIHMPQVQTYSVYTPIGSGTSYSWVGRSITTASQQSPKLDFGDDSQNILVADVNNDGLVDVMYSSGTALQTFFSLGRYPNGDGQFGYAQWTGPASSQISNDPVQFCLPYNGLPVQFEDSNAKLADMNGDGLQDIVYLQQGNIVYWPGRGNGYFGTGDPGSCPAGTFGENTAVAMAQSPWYSDPNGSTVRLDDVNGDGLDDLVQIGFNYVEIWLNVDGAGWTGEHIIQGSPPAPSYANRVRLVDANGSGTRDVLWGDASSYKYIDLQGSVRPWTLTHVQNGLGKTTDIQYASSTQLMLAAAASGTPWTSVVPNAVHVVTQVTDRDNLDKVGRAAGVYATQYTYANPVYDGRQREFRGFSSAAETRLGDASSPTSTASSEFLLGQCKNDENESPDPCTEDGRWEDNPREPLKGLPVVSETSDLGGDYLSTVHHTYRLRKLYRGLDGREVRYVFGSQMDTFAYDDAPFKPASQSIPLTDVELETAPPACPTCPSNFQTDTTELVTVRATTGQAHMHKSSTVDAFGNAVAAESDGQCGPGPGCAPNDEQITTTTLPGFACNGVDPSGWMYRTVESYVTGSQTPGTRKHTMMQYDCGGNPTVTQVVLEGTLLLDRFYSDTVPPPPTWNGPAPAPQNASAGVTAPATITTKTEYYDSFGNLVLQTEPNARCRQILYPTDYKDLPVTEIVYVGMPPQATTIDGNHATCGPTGLSAIAYYDRGFRVVTQVVDLHGEVTTAGYDGFSRLATLSKPDPTNVGKPSAVPSINIQYFLPANPLTTPYTIVHTQTQDGATTSTSSYRDSWAYADGLGRAIVTLNQADVSAGDGGQWIVNGLTDYDGKGAARRAYLAWFWSGDPQQFPLGTVPSTPYESQRYDAFGRKLQTFALDGTISLQSAYHALSVDQWDAADLMPGPHQGTPATATKDGHGRTTVVTERIHNGGAIEAHDTRTTYLSTGEPAVITRVNEATGAQVVRWMQYDSLSRMVLNAEPDSTKNWGPPGTPSGPAGSGMTPWIYAYDDNGDLVGTSDARGCGANYFYDTGGRVIYEDFSPCLASHEPYSTPQTNGDGTEAFYQYDAPDADTASVAGCVDPTLSLGRLVVVSDRGAKTATGYDGRGRTTCLARRIAAPTPSTALASRYAGWFVQNVTYDGADRPVRTTTGADVQELLDSTGQSYVTTSYSKRGTVSSVGSGYGSLVASSHRDADGLVNQIVYGDVAATTSAFTYDTRRRLSSVQTYRGPPAVWSQPPASYQPPPDPNGTPTTFQLLLEDLDYLYDAVDNPVEIRDYRNPAEWPAGAQPVTRKTQYDDLYRVTQVSYAYPGGTDTWVDPFYAEDNGIDPDPRRAQPSPHTRFSQRVLSQTFQYDWLGNTTNTGDDQAGFYDRSLGAIANGSAAKGPYQLQSAQAGGSLTAAYDDAGNLTSLAVNRNGPCLPSGVPCSLRFVYQWDEVGRLADARRWDLETAGTASDALPQTPASGELSYAYDATNNRTLKIAVGAATSPNAADTNLYTAYVFESLELRRTSWDANQTDYVRDYSSEVGYLLSHGGERLARLQYALDSEPSLNSGRLHTLLELTDALGSTTATIDHDTGELVEFSRYLPFGGGESTYRPARWSRFREDYTFTGKEEDVELGLQYFGKRYLSPPLGRWLSADPLGVHEYQLSSLNVYAYVNGRLLRSRDPIGLQGDGPQDAGAEPAVGAMKPQTPIAGTPGPGNPPEPGPVLDKRDSPTEQYVQGFQYGYAVARDLYNGRPDLASQIPVPDVFTRSSAAKDRASQGYALGMAAFGFRAYYLKQLPGPIQQIQQMTSQGDGSTPAPTTAGQSGNISDTSKPAAPSVPTTRQAQSAGSGSGGGSVSGGGGGGGTGGDPGGGLTSRAARRKVMADQGIPLSQQPQAAGGLPAQSQNASGRSYTYVVPSPGGGTEIKSVQEQTMDFNHSTPHWECGTVKRDSMGRVKMNPYGNPRLDSDKSKEDFNL